MNSHGKKTAIKIIITFILFIAVLIGFAGYTYMNKQRISKQNASYLRNSTLTTANWVEGILDGARSSIKSMADLYGRTLDGVEIDPADLQSITDNALFDYVEFVDADGRDINVQGVDADVSDRSYFIKGMQGESGMDGTYTSKTTGERLVIFYAPVVYEGEIVGVLTGHYQEKHMRQILSDRLFDEPVPSALCLPDGTMVTCVGTGMEGDNILTHMKDRVSPEEMQGLTQALAEEKEFAFNYRTDQGMTKGFATSLPGNSWTLVQLFPVDALNRMQGEANFAGMLLEIELIVLFVAYIVFMLLQEWYLRRRLFRGKQQAEGIITGLNRLFSRFLLVDLEKGTYEYLNSRPEMFPDLPARGNYEDFLAYIRNKVIVKENQTVENIFAPGSIRQRLNRQTPFEQHEYQIRIDDELKWQNTSVIALEYRDDKVFQVLLAVQEITGAKEEELRTHEALRQAYQSAEAANRAKSDFLSRMSHDIRTPMNAIMGMTSIAQMHMDDRMRLEDCLNKIDVSSRHLLRLINEVLDMSKIESGKLELMNEEFDLSEMVNELLGIFHPQMEIKSQYFSATMSGVAHERVIGDAQRLSQVLVNIMGNAVKFTPVEGCISLHINETPSRIEGRSCYEFTVTDTGIGMDQEFVEKIFEPFSRATDSRTSKTEGTGLGMSIAKNLVNMMNGDIEIKSKKGEGTRIKVDVILQYVSQQEEESGMLAGRSVIVVDDEVSVCENACSILTSLEMDAAYYTDADDAVEALVEDQQGEQKIAAVILDWRMPKKNGVEIAREIREKIGPNMPIIILSGYDWSAIEHEAVEAGVNDFIAKPLFKSRLVYVMKKALLGKGEDGNDHSLKLEPDERFLGKRLLIAEDNELNMEIAMEILTMAGFAVDKVWDGKEAVDCLLHSEPGTYQLVLMDIQMPVMDGYEATQIVRKSGREDLAKIPIIAMTADAFSDDVRKAREIGMNGHIAKPIDINKLIEALKGWL